ncbi:MAG: TonB-dependent receptor [Spirochaetota bacterium]
MKFYKYYIFQIILVSIIYFSFSVLSNAQEIPVEESAEAVGQEQDESNSAELKGDVQDNEKIIKQNMLVITATKTRENKKDVPVNVEVITSKDIEATGATSAGDVLGQLETGHFHKYSGLQQSAGLHGNFRTDSMGDDIKGYVLILVDGHRIGTGNLGKIPPEAIERIEIIKGPASSLYGSAAMGGVINIITKKGRGKPETDIKNEYGSFDYMKGSAASGGSATDLFSYFVSGSFMHVGDYETKKYGTVHNSSEDHKQIWGNLSLYPKDNQSLRLGFSYANIIAHYPEWKNWQTYTKYEENTNCYTDKSRGHSDLEYNLGLYNDKLHWKSLLYFLWDRNSLFWASPPSSAKDSASINNNYTAGADQQFTVSLVPYNKIIAGYTFEFLRKEIEAKENGIATKPSSPDTSCLTNSIYAQDSVDLLNNTVNLIAGVRYDRFDFSTEKPKNSTYTEKSFDHVSPRGGVVYKLTDFLRFRGNVGHAYKAPSADELTAEYMYMEYGTEKRTLGNPDLKAETSTSYEGGSDLYLSDLNLGSTYTLTNTKNKIERTGYTVPYNGYDWYTFENIGKSRMQAVECYLNWAIGKTLNLPVAVNFNANIVFNLQYENRSTGQDLNYVSDKEIKTNLSVGYRKAVVTLFYVYIGKQKHENFDNYPATVETKSPFRYYDLTFKYDITPVIEVNGGVFNLTNKNYEWVRGYPMPERNYKIGLTGKF